MVHWAWLIVSTMIGANIGLLVFSLCSIAKESDKRNGENE